MTEREREMGGGEDVAVGHSKSTAKRAGVSSTGSSLFKTLAKLFGVFLRLAPNRNGALLPLL